MKCFDVCDWTTMSMHSHTHTHTESQTHEILHNMYTITASFMDRPTATSNGQWFHLGPSTDVPESPIEVFELFLSNNLQEEIVQESNRYAKQVMGYQKYQSWTGLWTSSKLFWFLDLDGCEPSTIAWWLLEQRSTTEVCSNRWQDSSLALPGDLPVSTLCGQWLHVVTPHDWLGKVRPLITHLSDKFATLYEPR